MTLKRRENKKFHIVSETPSVAHVPFQWLINRRENRK